jgi:hypothetical protein
MACHKVGFFYENAIGSEKSIKNAIEYYEKGFEQGELFIVTIVYTNANNTNNRLS